MHWRLSLRRIEVGRSSGHHPEALSRLYGGLHGSLRGCLYGSLPASVPRWLHHWLERTGSLTKALSELGHFRVQPCYQGRMRITGGWRVKARVVALYVNDQPVVWALTVLAPPGGKPGLLAHPRCDWPFWRTLGERSLGTELARRLPVAFRQAWAPRQRALRQQQQSYQRVSAHRWQGQVWRPVQQSWLRQGKDMDTAVLPRQLQGWLRQRAWQPPRIPRAQATALNVIECFTSSMALPVKTNQSKRMYL